MRCSLLLLATSVVLGNVHLLAETNSVRDFASMHSGSSVLCSVEGHAPCHFFASAHTCPVASSRGWTTQTCAPEDGLLEQGSKQPHTLFNSACIPPKFGGLHATAPHRGFVHLMDHVSAYREHTRHLRNMPPTVVQHRPTSRITLYRSVHCTGPALREALGTV